MPRLESIEIENFRSIGNDPISVNFPQNEPVILIGENNAGKSNILRAIDLMFGEFHPQYKKLDSYDYFNRDKSNQIVIKSKVSNFNSRLGKNQEFKCTGFIFESSAGNRDTNFSAIQCNGEQNKYVSTKLREELMCVCVSSDQNLSYQMSYASKYTFLSKLSKAFHDKLTNDELRVEKLKSIFNNLKEVFNEVKEFAEFNENMCSIAGEMLSNMTHHLDFDFSAYDPNNYFKSLQIQASEKSQVRSLEEIGTGQQQILALSFAHAYAKSFLGQGLIFIIDEPEAHLHPLAQRWLSQQISKMVKEGLQIIITTHSPYFIDLNNLEGINLVNKKEQTLVKNITKRMLSSYCIEKGATKATENNIIPFYASHSKPNVMNAFFSKKVILVEGETEELALPVYLEAVGLNVLQEGIAVIGVSGKGNLAKWWRFFSCYELPVYVCFDNDSNKDDAGARRKEYLKAIGILSTDLEKLLTSEDWNHDQGFCIFGRDFETTLRSTFDNYKIYEDEERKRLGSDSKSIIAKSVARRILNEIHEKDKDSDELKHFKQLKQNIINLNSNKH